MKSSAIANADRETSLLDELRVHLCTHLDSDYAAWVAGEIAELCRSVQSTDPRERQRFLYAAFFDDVTLSSVNPDKRWIYAISNYPPSHKGRGRPRDWYWPGLIRWINDYYPHPRCIGRVSRGRHFEKTVKLALRLAGFRPEIKNRSMVLRDAADKIADALKGIKYPTERARSIQHIWRAMR